MLNKRMDFIRFRNLENPPDRPVKTGKRYYCETVLSTENF